MKKLSFLLILLATWVYGQNIAGIQLFNPQTNDETPIIGFNEQLILRFDDLSNSREVYRYTIKHLNRNWKEDNLFYTEYAEGAMSGLINKYQTSFNTLQAYTHYELTFPNQEIRPKISGNYVLIVYKTVPEKPLFTRRFVVVENMNTIGIQIERYANAKYPDLKQRLRIRVNGGSELLRNVSSVSLSAMQNNNWYSMLSSLKPSTTLGNALLFQQATLAFPGNNEFYYFDTKNLQSPIDMVAQTSTQSGSNEVYLFPVLAYPLDYQYLPDVNGAFYFRRNDNGIERDANTEADYAWVHFALDSHPLEGKKLYVLGKFNEYNPAPQYEMKYNPELQKYMAKIYLKQGFYNYILATQTADGKLNYGEINGNFWEASNLYQAIVYYRTWDKNYDAAFSYGEIRPKP